jgi:hypothetical protein
MAKEEKKVAEKQDAQPEMVKGKGKNPIPVTPGGKNLPHQPPLDEDGHIKPGRYYKPSSGNIIVNH